MCDFATGKSGKQWKMDYLKRYLTQKIRLDWLVKMKRLNSETGIKTLMNEFVVDRQLRIELNDRQQVSKKIVIDNDNCNRNCCLLSF